MDNDLMARRLRPPSEPATSPQAQSVSYIDSEPPLQDQFPWEDDEGARTDPVASAQPVWTPAPTPFAPPPQPLPVAPQPPAQPDPTPYAQVAPPVASVSQAPIQPQPAAFASTPAPAPWVSQTPVQPQPQAAEPFTWPTAREEAPWDRPTEYPTPADTLDPDQPGWDRPSPTDWIDPEQVDDRSSDMFEVYADRQMAKVAAAAPVARPPVISAPEPPRPISEPSQPSEPNAADPYDAYAPVLGDVALPTSRPWPETNGHDHGRNAPTVAAVSTPPALATPTDFSAHFPEPPPAQAQAHDVGPAVGSTFTLSEPTVGPATWATKEPSVTLRVPIPPSGMGVDGLGPTPPPGLFDQVTVVEARLLAPEPQAVAPALHSLDSPGWPGSPEDDTTDEQSPRPAVSLYSNAPPTPLVVRIELAFVDGSNRVVGAAEAARRVGPVEQAEDEPLDDAQVETEKFMPRHPAFEPRGPRAQEIYDIPAPAASPYEAPVARPSPITPTEASAPFAWPASASASASADAPVAAPAEPEQRPVEPFVWPSPESAAATDWIEPIGHAEPWPNDFVDGSREPAPPWIHAPQAPEPEPTPWAAQDYTAPEESFPPLVPLVRPAAAPQPAPAPQSALPWPERTYVDDPLAQLPAAAVPAPTSWPQVFQQPVAAPVTAAAPMAPSAAPVTPSAAPVTPFSAPASTQYSAPVAAPFSPPAATQFSAPAEAVASAPMAPALPAITPQPAPRPASYDTPAPIAATAVAPSLSASDRSDLWFLSTEPDTAAMESAEAADAKEPSSFWTAVLTIGMAVLVIALVFVFIQLMTSLLG